MQDTILNAKGDKGKWFFSRQNMDGSPMVFYRYSPPTTITFRYSCHEGVTRSHPEVIHYPNEDVIRVIDMVWTPCSLNMELIRPMLDVVSQKGTIEVRPSNS